MDNSEFYTKGNVADVVTRINQVHTITIYCPLSDNCVKQLWSTFHLMLFRYQTTEELWTGVPAIDALNAFIFIYLLKIVSQN